MGTSENFIGIKKKLKKNLEKSIEMSMTEIQIEEKEQDYRSSAMLIVDQEIRLKEPERPRYDVQIIARGREVIVKTSRGEEVIENLKIKEI